MCCGTTNGEIAFINLVIRRRRTAQDLTTWEFLKQTFPGEGAILVFGISSHYGDEIFKRICKEKYSLSNWIKIDSCIFEVGVVPLKEV